MKKNNTKKILFAVGVALLSVIAIAVPKAVKARKRKKYLSV